MYPQPLPFTKLPVFTNAKRSNRLLLSELFRKIQLQQVTMLPHGIMGNGITLVFIRIILAIYLIDVF